MERKPLTQEEMEIRRQKAIKGGVENEIDRWETEQDLGLNGQPKEVYYWSFEKKTVARK